MTVTDSTGSETFQLPDDFFAAFGEHRSALSAFYSAFLESLTAETENELNRLLASISHSAAVDFFLAATALVQFYRHNWTGPRTPPGASFMRILSHMEDSVALEVLVLDGEYPYSQTQRPDLLVFAKQKLCLAQGAEMDQSLLAKWTARSAMLHMKIMDGPCPTLQAQILQSIPALTESAASPYASLEACIMMQFCDRESEAEAFLKAAMNTIGAEFKLVGRLGRRTKHQTFDVYQLTVEVTRTAEAPASSIPTAAMPVNVLLNDDHLRETVSFTEAESPESAKQESAAGASFLERALLLAHATQLFKFHARDTMTIEKIGAYLDSVLETPSAWQIYSAALFWRSKAEAERLRMMERACLQFKALAEQVTDTKAADVSRLDFSGLASFPAEWECDREQGLLFARLGAFKTALDIFERRGMFNEAVQCLLNLGQVEAAGKLVDSRLLLTPCDPKLICILGDVERERWNQLFRLDPSTNAAKEAFHRCEQLYRQAWSISNGRLARAQRNLGAIYYVVGDWKGVIDSLSLAVAINPLFESSWFLLGLAYLQLEAFSDALRAFTRVISLNSDSPDGWKNIAHCHVQLNCLEDAFRALKQVTRLCFDQSDAWMSLFGVSLSVGEPREAINALRRYVDILTDTTGKLTSLQAANVIAKLALLLELITRVRGQVTGSSSLVEPVLRGFEALLDYFGQSALSSHPAFWSTIVAGYLLQGDKRRGEALMKAYRAMQSRPFERDAAVFEEMCRIVRLLKEEESIAVEDCEAVSASVKRRCRDSFSHCDAFQSL